MAVVRQGIYLEQNRPSRSQFRVGRRDNVRPVIVVHTAESGTDRSGPDPKAENVANFIRTRSTAGSYHLIGDADSIIQLVRFSNEAFQDGTGSNRFAIGISLAMNAADWSSISASRRSELTDTAAQMAALAAEWLVSQGLDAPAAQRLSKAESNRTSASGFISHAERDPTRRSDPGRDFPWTDFLNRYQVLVGGGQSQDQLARELQRLVGVTADGDIGPISLAALNRNWLGRDETFDSSVADTFMNNPAVIAWVQQRLNDLNNAGLTTDGEFGDQTESAVVQYLDRSGIVAAESFVSLLETR